jgi:hypothetical protein
MMMMMVSILPAAMGLSFSSETKTRGGGTWSFLFLPQRPNVTPKPAQST